MSDGQKKGEETKRNKQVKACIKGTAIEWVVPLIQYFQAINYLYGTVENWWRALQKRTNMISYSYDETGFRTRKGMTGTQTWFDRDAAGNLVHEMRNNGADHLYYYYDANGGIGSISYNR